jgi:late competence protein required for DNA uptake (superfamily II DNA/RNA helicase)
MDYKFTPVDYVQRLYKLLPIMKWRQDGLIHIGAPRIDIAEELRQRVIDNLQEELHWMQRSKSKSMMP